MNDADSRDLICKVVLKWYPTSMYAATQALLVAFRLDACRPGDRESMYRRKNWPVEHLNASLLGQIHMTDLRPNYVKARKAWTRLFNAIAWWVNYFDKNIRSTFQNKNMSNEFSICFLDNDPSHEVGQSTRYEDGSCARYHIIHGGQRFNVYSTNVHSCKFHLRTVVN